MQVAEEAPGDGLRDFDEAEPAATAMQHEDDGTVPSVLEVGFWTTMRGLDDEAEKPPIVAVAWEESRWLLAGEGVGVASARQIRRCELCFQWRRMRLVPCTQ